MSDTTDYLFGDTPKGETEPKREANRGTKPRVLIVVNGGELHSVRTSEPMDVEYIDPCDWDGDFDDAWALIDSKNDLTEQPVHTLTDDDLPPDVVEKGLQDQIAINLDVTPEEAAKMAKLLTELRQQKGV